MEAKETFEKILALSPSDIEAKVAIAQIYYQMGKMSEADVRVESLRQEAKNDPIVWILSAKLRLAEGNRSDARDDYLKAKELNPTISEAALDKEFGHLPPVQPTIQSKMYNTDFGPLPEDAEPTGMEEDFDEIADDDADFSDVEMPRINFLDVGGMENIKEEIRLKIIYPSKNAELYRMYGKKTGGGVLLYGPPGCGKTLVSRATAGEIKSHFISIGLHQILDMYIGSSEKNLHALFEVARSNTPSVLFIDEIDALAANRSDFRHSAARTLINQFLAEMDGSIESNDGVLIIGATNAPWHIDHAFRRPGRFDSIIFVPPPDDDARAQVIKLQCREKPIESLDLPKLIKATEGFSGADIKALFDATTEAVLTKALKENRLIRISTNDLLNQAKKIVPSTKSWFETARNYALYSNQSGLYDPILNYLGIKKP